MANDGERLSLNGLSAALGLSWKSAKKHVDSGLFRPDRNGRYDLDKCRALYEAVRDPEAVEKGQLGAGVATGDDEAVSAVANNPVARARHAKLALEAQAANIKLKRMRGELIDREQARRAVRAVIATVNERLDGAAAQIAVRVAGMSNAAEIERVVKDVLRSARGEVAAMAGALEQPNGS